MIFIAVWAFLYIGGYFYLIKKFGFYKRIKVDDYNLSESIFLVSMLITSGIIITSCIENINKSFDIFYKTSQNNFYFEIIKNACGISFLGFIIGALMYISGYFFCSMFFENKNQILEFENNNISYSLVRSRVLIVIVFVFYSTLTNLLGLLVPNDILFYR